MYMDTEESRGGLQHRRHRVRSCESYTNKKMASKSYSHKRHSNTVKSPAPLPTSPPKATKSLNAQLPPQSIPVSISTPNRNRNSHIPAHPIAARRMLSLSPLAPIRIERTGQVRVVWARRIRVTIDGAVVVLSVCVAVVAAVR